jgi:hypothetical protein
MASSTDGLAVVRKTRTVGTVALPMAFLLADLAIGA